MTSVFTREPDLEAWAQKALNMSVDDVRKTRLQDLRDRLQIEQPAAATTEAEQLAPRSVQRPPPPPSVQRHPPSVQRPPPPPPPPPSVQRAPPASLLRPTTARRTDGGGGGLVDLPTIPVRQWCPLPGGLEKLHEHVTAVLDRADHCEQQLQHKQRLVTTHAHLLDAVDLRAFEEANGANQNELRSLQTWLRRVVQELEVFLQERETLSQELLASDPILATHLAQRTLRLAALKEVASARCDVML